MCRLWVYNAGIFSGALGTSPHQWFNRGNEIQKKVFFWDTLVLSKTFEKFNQNIEEEKCVKFIR